MTFPTRCYQFLTSPRPRPQSAAESSLSIWAQDSVELAMASFSSCVQAVVLPGLELRVWVLDGQDNPYPYHRDPHCFAVDSGKFSVRLHLEGTDEFKKQYNVCWDRLLTVTLYVDSTWVVSQMFPSLPAAKTVNCKVLSIPGISNVEHELVFKMPEARDASSCARRLGSSLQVAVLSGSRCPADKQHKYCSCAWCRVAASTLSKRASWASSRLRSSSPAG